MALSATFIQARIDKAEERIDATEEAIHAITVGGAQSYTLDTGQNVQKVTKLDLKDLRASISSDLNLITTLEARLTGSGVVTVRPAF